jgi:hypothetical protein
MEGDMEIKLGDTVTQEMLDEIKLTADSLETAKGQITAMEQRIADMEALARSQ